MSEPVQGHDAIAPLASGRATGSGGSRAAAVEVRAAAPDRLLTALLLGTAVTVAAWLVGEPEVVRFTRRVAGVPLWHSTPLLLFGLLLALATPRRSGLRFGEIGTHWKRVVLVCGIPVALTAVVYPELTTRPFAGASAGMWLVSPLGQDLVFAGFLYGAFARLVPGRIHARLPFDHALVLSAVCFSAWHVQNFWSTMPIGFVGFQLAYTLLGFLLAGLSRQWTGSMLYVTLSHSAVNWIAWLTS